MRRPTKLLLACAGLAWSVAGCDAASDPAGSGARVLEGREFLLDSAEGFTPVPDTTVRIDFGRDELGPRFGFYADCNHHSGPYELRDGRLVVLGLGSTEIGCGEALSSQDRFLSDFFIAGPSMEIDGDQLTFTGDSATLVFLDREQADPDRPLTGRLWTVDSFIQGDGVSSLPIAAAPTVRFEEDGLVDVFSGCNSGGGAFAQRDGEIVLSGMSYTEEGCEEPTASAEAHVQAVLSDGVVSFEIEASRLTLLRGDLGLGAGTD